MFVSARYGATDPLASPDAPKQVQAIDAEGRVWALTEDSQVGEWLDYMATGGTIDPFIPPPISKWDVDAERDRRIFGGFEYMGHTFQSDEFSQRNIADATQAANMAIAEGAGDTDYSWQQPTPTAKAPPGGGGGGGGGGEDFYWIAADNTKVPMTAYDVRGLGQNMVRFKQAMIRIARDMKDMDPIPMDYNDDSYWVFIPPLEIPL